MSYGYGFLSQLHWNYYLAPFEQNCRPIIHCQIIFDVFKKMQLGLICLTVFLWQVIKIVPTIISR